MVVNVVLPVLWLCGEESGNRRLCDRVWRLYRAYPKLANNSLTRFVGDQVALVIAETE